MAVQLLAEANARIENTIREIKEAQAEKEKTRIARQKFEQFKTELEETPTVDDKISKKLKQINDRKKRKQQKREESNLQPTAHTVLMKGDSVRLKGQNSVGEVLSVNGNEITVAFGLLKSTVKADRLEKVSKNQIKKENSKATFISSQTTDDMREKQLNFKQVY